MKLYKYASVLLTLIVSTTALSDWNVQEEHWYGVTIDGAKAGWAHDLLEVDGDLFRTTKVQNLSISRGGMVITIAVTTEFIETSSGDPISIKSTQSAMGTTSETLMEFGEEQIQMTSVAGGTPIVKTLPLPDADWLTPREVTRFFIEKAGSDASAITYQTMSPELGAKIITVVMTRMGSAEREILGKKIAVTLWKTENDVMPIVGNEEYTSAGLSVNASLATGFGNIVNALMSKHEALSPINEIPELMVSLFVEPDKPIRSHRKSLSLRVKSKDGSALTLPTSGAQRASANDDGSVMLEINVDSPAAATQEEIDNPIYLSATSICDGTDEAVASIAQDALKNLDSDASELTKALALRAKVFDYIVDKNMSTAFASASQTARDKKGDCSEHGVLLCGLLRSVGIPSRGVLGMVYVPSFRGNPNGIFGWHMWSQALIDGQWIDLDATLRVPYHAGHIATATTSLADEALSVEMATILSTIGNIEVEVVEVSSTSK